MCIKVIGIDPAPSKKSTVFDGKKFYQRDANQLKEDLQKLKDSEESVLICWDAPLTGPRNPDTIESLEGNFTKRIIEKFFSKAEGMKTPTGISVLGYSSCPHWTITRAMLGLPRVGCYDTPWENLPFQLIVEDNKKSLLGKYVVEVHPAVALWLWLKDITNIQEEFEKKKWMKKEKNKKEEVMDWTYKYDKKEHVKLQRSKIEFFCEKLEGVFFNDKINKSLSEAIYKIKNPQMLPQGSKLDDIFDAMLAWLLGKLWIEQIDNVILLGNIAAGAMLLPNINGLQEMWNTFINPPQL